MTKNFEHFLGQLGPEVFATVVKNAEASRTVKNPLKDEAKYNQFLKAVELLYFFSKGTGSRITVDNADSPISFHSATIELAKDELNGNELQKFADIITKFDSMMFMGDIYGNIKLSLIIEDVYVESL